MRLITNDFRLAAAKEFHDSFSENNTYYIGLHKTTPYPSDTLPPEPINSLNETLFTLSKEFITAGKIDPSDVAFMIRNIPWTTNTVYDEYSENTVDLDKKNFFVVSYENNAYHVFKCIFNNYGAESLYQPKRSEVDPYDDFYKLPDGYEWKFMFTITQNQYDNFATNLFVPAFEDNNVVNAAIDGSIDVIKIENPGINYYSFVRGNIKTSSVGGNNMIIGLETSIDTLSSNNAFYNNCSIYIESGQGAGQIRTVVDYFTSGNERRILINKPFDIPLNVSSEFTIAPQVMIRGDGVGATARCIIDQNGSIDDVQIINRGKDYTHASIQVVGNTGFADVEANLSAILHPVISPKGGHGSNPVKELYGRHVAVVGKVNGAIHTNDFRKITLIKNPLIERNVIEISEPASSSGLIVSEFINQPATAARGRITGLIGNTVELTEVFGQFDTSDIVSETSSLTKTVTNVYDNNDSIYGIRGFQTSILDAGLDNTGFIEDETAMQSGLFDVQTNIARLILSGAQDAYGFEDGEIIRQTNLGGVTAEAKVVTRYENVLTIESATSYFSALETITGLTSGMTAIVEEYDDSFDANGAGTVLYTEPNAIYLADISGEFVMSDDSTNVVNTLKGSKSQAVAKLEGEISLPKYMRNTGEYMYVENILPASFSNNTKRVKMVIEF